MTNSNTLAKLIDPTQFQYTHDICSMCGEQKELKLPEKLCGKCWRSKQEMRKRQRKQIQKSFKKADQRNTMETPKQGEKNCERCGRAVPLYGLNAQGMCSKCQAEINWKMHKEEKEYEDKRRKKR